MTHRVDEPGEVGVVGQVLGEAAVVEAQELPEHEAGHELRLGELLRAVAVAVGREGQPGRVEGEGEDPARGFARSHILTTRSAIEGCSEVLYRARMSPFSPR